MRPGIRSLVGTVANVGVILVVLIVLLQPGGWLRESYESWRTERAVQRSLAESWDELVRASHRLGGEGPIRLIEFSDFQCPFCQSMSSVLSEFWRRNPEFGVGYLHLPLPIHAQAESAAMAALCAAEQARFERMHDVLFAMEDWEPEPDWSLLAGQAHVEDIERFERCLVNPSTAAKLDRQRSLAAALRIQGTPTFVTAEVILRGAQDLTTLEEAVAVAPSPH